MLSTTGARGGLLEWAKQKGFLQDNIVSQNLLFYIPKKLFKTLILQIKQAEN